MVSFIANTPIESLPFEDKSIDVAISQWGLEYSNPEQTIPELGRVLKPRAKMCFVCHHEHSDIIRDSLIKVEKYRVLIEEDIHDRFLALDDLYNSKLTLDQVKSAPSHLKVLGRLNKSLNNVMVRLKNSKDNSLIHIQNYIQELTNLFAAPKSVRNPDRKNMILAGLQDIEKTIGRIDDLFAASLSTADHERLLVLIENEGFDIVHQGPLIHRGTKSTKALGDIGLKIVAQRGY